MDKLYPQVAALVEEFLVQVLLFKRCQVAWVIEIALVQRIVHHDELTIREGLDDLVSGPGYRPRRGLRDLREPVLQVLVLRNQVALLVLNLHFIVTDEPHEARHELREQVLLVELVIDSAAAARRSLGFHER